MTLMTILLVLLVIAALWASMTTLLLRATIALALTSALLAVVMYSLGATLAAVLELSVCAGLISVVFVSVISLTQRKPFKEYVVRRASRLRRLWPLPLVLIAIGFGLSFVHAPVQIVLPLPGGDGDVRTVVLRASGDTFCAGFDLAEFSVEEPGFQERLWRSADRFHRTVLSFPLPVIAAVQGPALAGGFDLAVMCDIRLAATDARFGHPEQSWSDVVFSPLADLVGSGPARDLCMTGRSIDADAALRIGLVSAVVAPGDLAAEAAHMAALVARGPRGSLERTKAKALRRAGYGPDITTLEL